MLMGLRIIPKMPFAPFPLLILDEISLALPPVDMAAFSEFLKLSAFRQPFLIRPPRSYCQFQSPFCRFPGISVVSITPPLIPLTPASRINLNPGAYRSLFEKSFQVLLSRRGPHESDLSSLHICHTFGRVCDGESQRGY
jgi:hypothetical protein